MAAYRRIYDSRHLQADCQERDQLRNLTLGNRVWATFTLLQGALAPFSFLVITLAAWIALSVGVLCPSVRLSAPCGLGGGVE